MSFISSLPACLSRLYHAHLLTRACSETPQPGVEGQRGPERGFRGDGGRRGPAVPTVWGALQNSHPAARTHGHTHNPPGDLQPQHHRHHLQREHSFPHQHGVQPNFPHQHGVQRNFPHQHGAQPGFPLQHGTQPGFPHQHGVQPGFPHQHGVQRRGGAAGFRLLRDSPPVLTEEKGGKGEI